MELKNLVITPVYIVLFTIAAYLVRPFLTNAQTKKYFLPALWIRFLGAIALGLIYQFYYGFGGDTFNFFDQSTVVTDALYYDFRNGLRLLLADGSYEPNTFQYTNKIPWYRARSEFTVIKLTAVFSFFSIKSYYSTAIFFSALSFIGSWLMFRVFQGRFPNATKYLSYAILFVPSVIFWGSGILKDTVTLACVGVLLWGIDQLIFRRKIKPITLVLVFISIYLIYLIKIYILLCFIPSIFLWWYLENVKGIRPTFIRWMIIPVFLTISILGGYYVLAKIASTSDRYSLETITERAYITAYDIRYYTGRNAGSGYDIGAQDGTLNGMIKLAPAAINVSLFRPYFWEVNNPLMVLSGIESFFFFIFTLMVFFKTWARKRLTFLRNPLIIMSLFFSLSFAFAVGVSTYNFGSLSRYKIPLVPFYASFLAITLTKAERIKN